MANVDITGYRVGIKIGKIPSSLLQTLPPEQTEEVLGYRNKLANQRTQTIKKIGYVNQRTLMEKERSVVGHSKSGYVPTGVLMRSIQPEFNGDYVDIIAPAESKKGYHYGTAVEYGTLKMPATPYIRPTAEYMVEKNEEIAREGFHE